MTWNGVTRHVISLWDETPPHALGHDECDSPCLEIFVPPPISASGGAMLIFPGGAYTFLSEKSGAQYGTWLAENGIVGVVVRFRLGSSGYRYPALIADAVRAMTTVAMRAPEFYIDKTRIGVIGTSAGGHLAALLVTGAIGSGAEQQSVVPVVGVLCYPVISLLDPWAHEETREQFLGDEARVVAVQQRFSAELHVTCQTAPCFVWHTAADPEVPVLHSEMFAAALRREGVECELHIYSRGPHALGLATSEGLHWSRDCIRWLRWHGL